MNKISFPLKLQTKGLEVADLQAGLVLLDFTIAKAEKTNQRYGPSTQAAVSEFQTSQKLPATGEVDAATAGALNKLLAEMGAFDPAPGGGDGPTPDLPTDDPMFSVQGEVVKPDGTALPNLVVRAYDRALCEWRRLGNADAVVRTNEAGRYAIEYDPAQPELWGKQRADLMVEVRDATADTVLAESPLILRALPKETVNFSIGKDRYRGPDEFSRLERALAPLLGSHADDLSCLLAADVLILAREANLSASNVAYYVKARRWSATYGVPAELFYALMRRAEPTRIDALWARPLAQLWSRLEEARSRNVISLPLTTALRSQLAQLQQSYLAQPEHPYARLLGTTGLVGEQSTVFTRRLTSGQDTGDAFWERLVSEDGFSTDLVADLRATFELQHFLGDNTSLSVRLRGDLGVRAPREVAAFSLEHWRDTVLAADSVEIPDSVRPGDPPEQRRAAYALMLYRGAEARDPTASLAGQMDRDPVWAQSPILAFLSRNPDLEFNDTRVLRFLRENPQALGANDAATRSDLLRVEQLFHLTDSTDKLATITPMWQAGLRAAPQVAAFGRDRLWRRLVLAVDRRHVQRIYRKAVHITSLALNVYLRFSPSLNRLSTAAVSLPQAPNATSAGPALARSALTMPEWEELFGSADACECPHDASALSAAAYLVDQMAFLEKAVDPDGNNALDELLTRRPDLGSLQLTPENTQTLMPHIDAVNEVLEAIVASADGKTLPGTAIGATTWDSELLAAQPQYLNPAAYDLLRESRYPIQALPFDLWAEEGRRYLRQLGIARHELMKALPPKPGVGPLEIATEALGMSRAERDLIRQPQTNAADLARSWGIDLAKGTLVKQLGTLDALLHQARVDYDTLLRLLNTRYINPGRLIAVSFAGTPCSMDGAVLVGEGGAALVDKPFREFLDRLHRFLRLQRRLAYPEYELDTLLAALGVSDFDAKEFVADMADVQSLRLALKLPLNELAAWWAKLDTHAFEDDLPSLYEAVFVNEALFPDIDTGAGPDLRNEVFALRADRADLAITTSTDAGLSKWLAQSDGADVPVYALQPDYAAYVQGAVRLTSDDLLLLVRDWLPKDGATGHVALNLANLSLLYRVASLARVLRLSVVDALRLFAIVGVVPLQSAVGAAGPAESRQFHDVFVELKARAHSVETLAYLLLHEADAALALAPSSADLDAWLLSVNAGFVGILATDDARITDELKASLTQSLASVLTVDATVITAVLFTHRPALGDHFLAHAIVSANTGAPGLPVLLTDFGTLYGQLQKFALAWNGLGLDPSFLAFVLGQGPALGWTDISALPMTPPVVADFEPWRRLTDAAALQASSFTLEQSLFTLMEDAAAAAAAQAHDPASFVLEDQLAQICDSTGWPLAEVTYLTGADGFNLDLPSAMRDERALVTLRYAFDLIRSTGISAEQAHAWTVAELSFGETQAIKQATSLAFEEPRWLDVLGTIQDELRTLKRDALLGHALTSLGLADSDAFYRQYLLDPDVAPMERTSRIVLAHSAVQLFAQRILLNLEDFKFGRLDAEAWQWRSRYRVWEAARKVFLWPENWLEPEWRDNKSPFFLELEDGLLQDDVTHESAERLYFDYLHSLNDVSRLEIVGMYNEGASEEQTAVLHVFGRGSDVPRRYYYRRWEDQSNWTPWEPVDLDINADHLIPVVYNGVLFLFWPEFTQSDNPNRTTVTTEEFEIDPERADEIRVEIAEHERRLDEIHDELNEGGLGEDLGNRQSLFDELDIHADAIIALNDELDALIGERSHVVLGDKYVMEIGLKWSEYRNGRWSGTHVTTDKLHYTTSNPTSRHYFTGWVAEDNVLRISARINMVGTGEGVETARSAEGYIGYFYFNESGADLVATSTEVTDPVPEVSVSGSLPNFHSAAWFPTFWSSSSLELEINASEDKRLLIDFAPGTLAYAHQDGQYGKAQSPFFFSDGVRTYMVRLTPDVRLASSVYRLPLSASTRRSNAWSRSSSALLRRSTTAAAATPVGVSASAQHFESKDTGLVMSHSLAGLDTTSLQEWVGTLIAADPDPWVIAGPNSIESIDGYVSRYVFTRFHHPHTGMFLRQQARYGIDGVLNPDPAWGGDSAELQRQLLPTTRFDFESTYAPNPAWVANNFDSEQMSEQIDFDHTSPFGSYHWELFFHIPMLVATRLMQNQRYADARRWFHYIFDPTSPDTDAVGPERFWKIKPFYLEALNGATASLQGMLNEGNLEYEKQLEAWESDPFNPFAIARLRITASMQAVVMRYTECLLDEADMLFRRDTREDINQARQLYLLAAAILGERPTVLPEQESAMLTPNLLLHRFRINWNGLLGGNPIDALVFNLPADLPGALAGPPGGAHAPAPLAVDASLSRTSGPPAFSAQGGTSSVDTLLLFCLPYNETLFGLWDKVADRLFKIRHSMNFSGQVRQLALFAPAIDPALLVRARAAGLSIEDILGGLFAPRPCYRFSFLLQKALELCNEARSLGGALLAALEKRDGEELTLLRSTHEVALLDSIRAIKKKNVEEAKAAHSGLVRTRELTEFRAAYYAGLDRISSGEQRSLDHLDASRGWQIAAEASETTASVMHAIPEIYVGTDGLTPTSQIAFGGPHLGAVAQAVASSLRARAGALTYQSSRAGTVAAYGRRFKDWKFQADLARKEMTQLDQQIIAAEIRQRIAEADLENHEQQLAQAEAVEDFLKLKFTNQQLYSWMVSKVAAVHFGAYQMACQMAVQAEAAFRQELGPDEQSMSFIKFDNWDSLKIGLLAGDLLCQQLRQMEVAHIAANKRELEITKHVSLFQLDPTALLTLRETGSCEIHVPEVLFDMDFPGHYFRRIKSARISIPCMVGPYTNVSATLTLNESWTRRNANLADSTQPERDATVVPQTAIATSSANQDGGMFELSFSDPRYLPFEGAGAIGTWGLELPSAIRSFDYDTITDVILHLSYSARDGGAELQEDGATSFEQSVTDGLTSSLNDLKALLEQSDVTLSRLFSLRQEFATEWNRLLLPGEGQAQTVTLNLYKRHFPKYLDYVWRESSADPITLIVESAIVYLNPAPGQPVDPAAVAFTVNDSAPLASDPPGLIQFSALSGLTGNAIDNVAGLNVSLSIKNGSLLPEEWKDMYILLKYRVDPGG